MQTYIILNVILQLIFSSHCPFAVFYGRLFSTYFFPLLNTSISIKLYTITDYIKQNILYADNQKGKSKHPYRPHFVVKYKKIVLGNLSLSFICNTVCLIKECNCPGFDHFLPSLKMSILTHCTFIHLNSQLYWQIIQHKFHAKFYYVYKKYIKV